MDMNPDELDDKSQSASIAEEIAEIPKVEEDPHTILITKLEEISEQFMESGNEETSNVITEALTFLKNLKTEISEVKADLEGAQLKVEHHMELAEIDAETIVKLRSSIENAWKERDAAQAREHAIQEELKKVQEKLDFYEKQKATGKKRIAESISGQEVVLQKDLKKEKEKLLADITELNRRLQIQRIYTADVERLCATLEEKNNSAYKLLDATSAEAFKEKKRVDALTKEMAEIQEQKKSMEDKWKQLKHQNETLVKNNVQQNMQILATKTNLESLHVQHGVALNKLAKAMMDLEQTNDLKEKIQKELSQKAHALKMKEEEFTKIKLEYNSVSKSDNLLLKKFNAMQQAKNKSDQDLARVRNEANNFEKQIISMEKTIDGLNKKVEELIKERDTLQKQIVARKRDVSSAVKEASLAKLEIKNLQNDIKDHNLKEKKNKEELSKTRREAERFIEQIQIYEDKIDVFQNEIQLKENYIMEIKKQLAEAQTKVSNVQEILESVRNEKNTLQRNLLNIIKEKNDLKEQLLTTQKIKDTLTENINNKENEILKLEFQCDKTEKDRIQLKIELNSCQVILQNIRSELHEKKLECENLYRTLLEDETKFKKLKTNFEEALKEKASLSAQITKKNDEINNLRENLRLCQDTIDHRSVQYAQRLEDIRLLRIEIQNLRSEQEILRKDRENAANTRKELLHVHRMLNQERIKARALQDEMLTPMNVHRWRSLRGKDPEKMELISKVQNLQKRIVMQSVEATARENTLEETQKLYLTLKDFMLKLPSYKVKEQLNKVRHDLTVKDKKLKALAAELNTKELNEKAKEFIVDELRCHLDCTRKELNKERQKRQKLLEERQFITHVQMQCFSAPPTYLKSTGGGFKMPTSG